MDFQALLEFGKYQMPIKDVEVLFLTADEIRARTIMEIGSARGCSSIVLGSVAKKNGGKMQCIEYKKIPEWHNNIAHYDLTDTVELINKTSPWVDNSDINAPIDYLFIDGCHRFRSCLVDYHWASKYVRRFGRIAFHDYHSPHNEVMPAIEQILSTDKWLKEVARSITGKGVVVFEKGR